MAGLLNVGEMAALALHEMVALAMLYRQDVDARITVHEIADRLGASVHTLQKVTRRLIAIGLAEGTRGAKGGVRLARNPEDITLIDIVEGIDGKVGCNRCLFGERICGEGKRCIFDTLTGVLENQVMGYLSGTSLADLCDENDACAKNERKNNGRD